MLIYSIKGEGDERVGVGIVQPVFPQKDTETVTAFISTQFTFNELFEKMGSKTVSGVDCVITANNETYYTFRIINGITYPVGRGDLHLPTRNLFPGACQDLTPLEENLYGGRATVDYRMCLYPTQAYVDTFSTRTRLTAPIFAVTVMALNAWFFMAYDRTVRRNLSNKDHLLEAKRSFMRFISHEVSREHLPSVSYSVQ